MQVTNALPYILPAYKIEARATETPGRFDLALDGTASKAIPCEDFLAHTDRLQPRFEAIIQASRRPGTFLAGDYSDPRRIPVLNPALKYADDCVQLRMQAHLWLDEYDKAAQDLAAFNALHKLAPPSDLSLAQAESNIARPYHTFVMIQSGFARHGWGSGHVETLIEFAQGQRPLRTFAKGFQNDQLRPVWLMENHFETNAMGSSLMSALRLSGSANEYALWDYMPGGWIRQSMANHIRPMLVLSDCYDGTRGVVSPEKFSSASKNLDGELKKSGPYHLINPAGYGYYSYERRIQYLAIFQTQAHLALLACALERHRLDTGAYPEKLDSLVPKYLTKIPHQVVSADPMLYRREVDGGCAIWSVGWDLKNDNGNPGPSDKLEATSPDWAWKLPKPKP